MLRNVRRQRSHVLPNYRDTNAVRDKLLQEIADLQNKLYNVEGSPSQSNLVAAQTFKEMIYSRNNLLDNISRQKDERSNFGVGQRLQ